MRLIIEPIVRAALLEDLGRAGDITTDAIVAEDAEIEAVIAARRPGVVAGLEAALLAFELIDPVLRVERICADGARISRGGVVRPHPRRCPGCAGRRAYCAQSVEPDVGDRHGDPGARRCDLPAPRQRSSAPERPPRLRSARKAAVRLAAGPTIALAR